ncbi:efflux MFS transporter permease [Flavobacterium caseinilyticum]|uniref:MFS transporter n=1 Tax=Flavobacterium caseinilyticum TaxID=2541732 RepID=A0A4V2YUU1_9FLAO|nr:MFS transporter [Flavobacterium caseinilyticum]TDD78567.1 MFS transporter [Flavobacterium caseinilyticum]
MAEYNQGLYKSWVPKSVQLLLIVVFTFLILAINPVNAGNIGMMVGDLGTMPDYLIMANFASFIGMATSMPLILRTKLRFRSKEIMVLSLAVIAFLSFVIGTTNFPELIIASSFLMGFFKMLMMMEVILPMMFILSPDGKRGKFYAVFYPFSIVSGNIAGYYLARLAYQTTWQYPQLLTAGLCLLMIMITILFQHNQRFARKMPFSQIDWLSIVFFAATFLFMSYFLSFGKTLNWFDASNIRISFWGTLVSFILLALRQLQLKRSYVSFSIFKKNNVQSGLLMLLFMGVFLGSSSLQNTFTVGILGYDMVTNASLNLMMIPGVILAGVVAYFWFKNEWPLKMFIFSGFAAFFLNSVMMYFIMVPEINYESWLLPMFLKGYGLSAIYIAVWFYILDKLEMVQMLQAIGLILVFRSFVVTAVFSSFFSWLQYQFQWESVNNFAIYLDGNLMSTQAALSGYKSLQLNAILAANKKIYGLICIASIGMMIYVLQHHFGKVRFSTLRWKEVRFTAATRKRKASEAKILRERVE